MGFQLVSGRAPGASDRAWRVGLVWLICALAVVPLLQQLAHAPEEPMTWGRWGLVLVSAVCNVIVMAYHHSVPPHPKFLVLPWRRLVIRTHVLSGTVELISGLCAVFLHSTPAAIVMAIAALCFHVPTASIQTPIVFGSKAIMIPGYVWCIGLHAFCAAMLIQHPTSQYWAINTFLIFNVYVWCRIYFYFFDWAHLFSEMKYTISILAAGLTVIPAVMGTIGVLITMALIGLYVFLYRVIVRPSAEEYEDWVREKGRESLVDRRAFRAVAEKTGEEEMSARRTFDALDVNKDGALTRDELLPLLLGSSLPLPAIDAVLDRACTDGTLKFEAFQEHVWPVSPVRDRAVRRARVLQARSERDRAQLVFEQLDVDEDGFLGRTDLDLLLHEWGMPHAEADRYLKRLLGGEQKRIPFDDFFHKLQPVWRFVYYEIDRVHDHEMVGRAWSEFLGVRGVTAMKRRVQQELVAQVPLFSHISKRHVADLAASLVTETFSAGTVIFAEGSVGDKFYIVSHGRLQVSRHGEVLAELQHGDCVGEGALLSHEPRNAAVTALTDTTVYSLTRSSFDFINQEYPDLHQRLAQMHQVRRNEDELRQELLGRLPFLTTADPSLIAELANDLVPHSFKPGGFLMKAGTPAVNFYVIEQGAVQVRKEDVIIATLRDGSCLGEHALLHGAAQRSADAVALRETRALSMTKEAFDRILNNYPGFRESLGALDQQRLKPE